MTSPTRRHTPTAHRRSLSYTAAANQVIGAIEASGRTSNAIEEYRVDVILGRCYETVPDGGLVATVNSDEFWACVEANTREENPSID